MAVGHGATSERPQLLGRDDRGWGIWKAMILMDQHAALAGGADPECIARDILTEA